MPDTTDYRATMTALLGQTAAGSRQTFDEVFALVYDELRRLAHHQLTGQWGQYTLDTTSLVHEVYLKLVDTSVVSKKLRAYFFAAAARAMRQVLVDAARRRSQIKRGNGRQDLRLSEVSVSVDDFAANVICVDDSLNRLAERFPRQAEVIQCRFFGGLSIAETAMTLDLSRRTVIRDWTLARAWLQRDLDDADVRSADDDDRKRTTG